MQSPVLRLAHVAACLAFLIAFDKVTAAEQMYDSAAVSRDLDQFLQNIVETHPDIEYTANLVQLHAEAAEIRAQLKAPMDVRTAWKHLARLNPLFGDAHVGLQYPVARFVEYRQTGGAVLPLPVYVDALDRVRVAESAQLPASVATHEEIVSINGQTMEDFLRVAMPLMRGETKNIQKLVLARNFAAYHWTINGGYSRYDATIRDVRGQTRIVSLPVTSKLADPSTPSEAFRYVQIGPDVGYVQVRSFDVNLAQSFRDFLAGTFADLKSKRIGKLILDLRENPGGAHELSDQLLQYLIRQPVRQASFLRARIVDANRSAAPSAALNDVVTIEHDEWLLPAENPNRFAGETLLLIGPRTYSQAIVFAATFQDFRLGRVAGEPTDGWANQTGQVQMMPLANTGLIAATPLYVIYRPSGVRRPGGVQPDVAIADDSANPKATLDRALQLMASPAR